MKTLKITVKRFKQLVDPVLPLACTDEKYLPAIAAVRVEARGKYLISSATDRFRLGMYRLEYVPVDGSKRKTWPAGWNATIPLSVVRNIMQFFKAPRGMDPELTFTLEPENQLTVSCDGLQFGRAQATYQLTDGGFPKLNGIIAKALKMETDGVGRVGLNWHFLNGFTAASSKHEPTVLHVPGGKSPVLVLAENFVGIQMPRHLISAGGEQPGDVDVESWREIVGDPPEEAEAS